MKRNLQNLFMTALLSVVSVSAWALDQVNGFYQIGSAADLKAFAELVNGGTTGANAVLSADIDYTAYTTGFIGTNSNRYSGTFDGQGHTVTTNIENSAQWTGLFGTVDGATIKNLVVDGNVKSSQKGIGGLGGLSYGSTTVQNVVVKSTLKFTGSGDSTCGGLFGDMEDAFTVENCAFLGTINVGNSGTNVGGLVSWTGSGSFSNCLVAPVEITAGSQRDFVFGGAGTCSNCYKVAHNDARLASGQLCYQLNGSKNDGTTWTQTIGTNAYPIPFSTSQTVHQASPSGYTNLSVIDDKTQIETGADLQKFAAEINAGNTAMDAVVTTNIDYRTYTQGFIGTTSNKYAGTFDGQMHTVTLGLMGDAAIRGLFAFINGATIRNLVVDGSISSDYKNIGGLGGQIDGSCTVENIVVNTSINFTGSGTDASCGGFFPYVNNDQTLTIRNCAFYGSIHAGTALGNAGLVAWNSGTINATNCLVAPTEIVSGGYDNYTRYNNPIISNCYYPVDGLNTRLASGELCYLLNGSVNAGTNWYQDLSGLDARPYPFGTRTVSAGKWFNTSTNDVYYNEDGEGNITVYQLNLDDTKTVYNVPAKVTAKNVKMNRSITAGRWNTFCSPVALAKSNYFSAVKELTGVDMNGDHYTMTFSDIEGDNLVAGKPYMVQVSSTVSELTASNVAVATEVSPDTDTDSGLTFNGAFTSGTAPESSFIISNNAFYYVNSTVTLGAFRGYITVPEGEVKALSFIFDDDETAIEMVNGQSSMVNGQSIYNLAGQRLNKVQKGINIVNGKKILK